MRRFLLVTLCLLLFAGSLVVVARRLYVAPGPLSSQRTIVLPRGSVADIARILVREGVVSSARAFRVAASLTVLEGPLHSGEFPFPAGASIETVLSILRTARPIQHRITIPEGSTAADIATLLARAGALSGDIAVPPEGAVFPETYAYERGASPASVETRAENAARAILAREWSARASNLPLASPEDALTLASVVERETPLAGERPLVAAVFLNRLRARQKLQSDPTTAYAVAGGLALARLLARDDLSIQNPYNTYWTEALPPGPICTPGLAALHAVLHPAGSRALYFVADGSGGHVFAETLAEHEANIARIRGLRH